ncbi:phytoene/squalene synthase family protein [Thalassospira sp. MCCC 1A01428]|uniref:phytoene/squalene synthase family protein n=1 Tax=Thalassospira sp. MCCC 1A01428 TaxID=1470575 RepID=UPI000A1F05F2|nr:phytoene/squalene synthase family protein [Thalassospira sp. MCCC 1A01428]OSQ41253.1 squalene [Thalassospira sp. MCCC 1A01428]
MTNTPDLSYCAEYVRRNDRDRFLCGLFAAPEHREDLFTLYAFNQEISKTREMVSEAMLGQIRLQWWRDALSGIENGDVRKHEVVEPLAQMIGNNKLDRPALEAMIDAREFDLFDTAPDNLAALDHYIDQTSGLLSQAAVGVLLGHREDSKNDANEAARRAGNAYGMVGILRAMVFHGRAKRQYVPNDVMEQFGVSTGDIFEFRRTDAVRAMTKHLAEHAAMKIRDARKMRSALPKSAIAAALPVILAENYLEKLKKADYDPFSAVFGLARPASFRLTLRAFSGYW